MGKFMSKIRNFDSFGGCVLPFCLNKRLSGQRVAPVGAKPIFGPLSKNNTGMAALFGGVGQKVMEIRVLVWADLSQNWTLKIFDRKTFKTELTVLVIVRYKCIRLNLNVLNFV